MNDVVTFEPQLDRVAALRPIVSQLLQLVKQRSAQSGTLKISVGPHTIEMTSWERAQVAEAASLAEAPSETAALLLEGVAAQARALNDLVRSAAITEDNADARERCRRDLVFDLALGLNVRRDLAGHATALHEDGKVGHARYIEQFLERFDANLASVQAGFGDEDVRSAQSLSADLARLGAPQTPSSASEPARAAASAPARDAAPERDAPARKTGLRPMHAMLASIATVALVAGTLIALPLATQRYEIQDGFRYMQGVVAWSGAPPSVKVTVNTAHWNALSVPDRTAMIFGIAAAVQKKGFTAADIETQDGKVVARWDRQTGIAP